MVGHTISPYNSSMPNPAPSPTPATSRNASRMASNVNLADTIRAVAIEQGFIACGIAPAITSEGFSELVKWIDAGYAADMDYFAHRIDAYRHPEGVLPGAKSVIALAWPYPAASVAEVAKPFDSQPTPQPITGRVARYTWQGTDYHDVIHPKLKHICRAISDVCPTANARGVVDTAPLMEREIAQLAGLGWRGKNTLLLNRTLGSYFFLACVLVDVELPTDAPFTSDHCGTCTACLDACPTDAFVAPHVLDASRCISYLTIENRDSIPLSLREGVGDWLFGCDVCQEVCPWNRKPTRHANAETSRDFPSRMELTSLFELDDTAFRERFRKTPMWRTRRRGLLRNAAIVLGNIGDAASLESLRIGLNDSEEIVRESCAWAIQRLK